MQGLQYTTRTLSETGADFVMRCVPTPRKSPRWSFGRRRQGIVNLTGGGTDLRKYLSYQDSRTPLLDALSAAAGSKIAAAVTSDDAYD